MRKKEQIVMLYQAGNHEVANIAKELEASPSYVADVLHKAGYLKEYFDLYTSTKEPMNIYSQMFANRIRFKSVAMAKASVKLLDSHYRRFEKMGDRAGLHHTLQIALTMFNRAHGIGKRQEAEEFRLWLISRLEALHL